MLGPVSQQHFMKLIRARDGQYVVCTCDCGTQGAKLKDCIIDWSHLYELALSQKAGVQVLGERLWQGCVAAASQALC